jgi:DnaJ like chaperone protein
VVLASFHLVTIDQKFTVKELKHIDNFFSTFLNKNKKDDLIWLLGLYKKNNINLSREKRDNSTLKALVKGANIYFTTQHKYTLLYYLFELAEADKAIENKELKFIFSLGQNIGLSKQDLNSITSLYFSSYIPFPEAKSSTQTEKEKTTYSSHKTVSNYIAQSKLQNALSIFNLEESATFEEIKAKYRKMVKKHHPDRVAHLGEEHVKKATALFKQITVAYQYLEQVKG